MIRCKGVAQLLTSGEFDQVSFWKQLPVRFHLWMCRHCSRLASQVRCLRTGARRVAESIDEEICANWATAGGVLEVSAGAGSIWLLRRATPAPGAEAIRSQL
jgi:hypothetical protein